MEIDGTGARLFISIKGWEKWMSRVYKAKYQGKFLDAPHQGKTDSWRFVVVLLCTNFYWWVLSGYVSGIFQSIFSALLSPEIGIVFGIFFPHALELLLLIFLVNELHSRHPLTLINFDADIDWERVIFGFGIWLLLLSIPTIADLWMNPQYYSYVFDPVKWLSILPFALVLIPIQTSAEEFLFRGYLMQSLGLTSRNPLLLVIVSSIAFTIPHLNNPEIARGFFWTAASYLISGILYAVITLKDNGLELALGSHAANNLFALLLNTSDSVIQSPTILLYVKNFDSREVFVSVAFLSLEFYFIFFGGIPRNSTDVR